jgi:predicted Zn-dependent protease
VTGKAVLALLLALILAVFAGCASPREPETIQANAPNADEPESDQQTNPAQTESPEASQEGSAGSSGEEEAGEAEEQPKRPERIVLDTVYDDQRVGEDQVPVIEAELGLVDDEELNRFVRSVAVRLLRHAPTRPFDYEFKIVDQSVPNAFALPGGKIFVSRGLLALATSEDELACVLGHEITHAAERHASAQIEYNRRINPLAIGLLRVAKLAAYGREQERDADRGGQMLAARAGYDPEALATFLRKLDAAERYEVGWSRIPRFYATHPTSPERSALATNRATTLEWTPVPPVSAEYPGGYYGAVDGLILGDDPAGGVFDEENRFIHPELRFSIRFPQGWTTMNSQQAVRAVSPMRDAQAELTLAGKSDEPLSQIVDDFIDSEFEGMKIRVRERREIKIGELPAIRIEGRTTSMGIGGLAAQMTFVAYGDFVYRLTVLSVSDSGTRFRGRARAFAHSFRPIEEETVRSLDVIRLRTARALESETLQELSIRTRNALDLVYTGVLNGLYASTQLAHRQPIKIGIKEPYLPRLEPTEDEEQPGTAEKSDVILEAPTP